MSSTYRFGGKHLLQAFAWPAGVGAMLALFGFFWSGGGNDLYFNLALLNDWRWLRLGLGLGLVLALWLRQVRLVVDANGGRAQGSFGLLRLRDWRWQELQRVEYRHRLLLGRPHSALRFTAADGYHFNLPLGAGLLPLPGTTLSFEQAVEQAYPGVVAGNREATRPTQVELGLASALLTYTALLLAAAGLLMLANWRAHYLGAVSPWLLLGLALPMVALAVVSQRRSPQRVASVFIGLLATSAWVFFCWSAGMSLPVALGQTRPLDFHIAEDTPAMQVWEAPGQRISLSVDAAHRNFHGQGQQTLQVYQWLGLSALDQDEYTRLVTLD
jgi:hypothetical protein